ncbi:MAG TPA: hypothetical protein VK421_01615 [Pyrinomonadaceae bacterium]|nr:hypothetical protein [Pyrinomonadaceae bacterium]
MRRLTPLLRRGAKALAAPLCLCCLLALAAHDARADEVTVAGSTSGTFTTPGPLGTNTGPSLTGLQFISSTFDVTTSGGAATLNGPAANPNTPGSANVNNLGSFYLQPPPDMTIDSYNGAR